MFKIYLHKNCAGVFTDLKHLLYNPFIFVVLNTMKNLKVYTHSDIAPLESVREGAVTFSKKVTFFLPEEDLQKQLLSTSAKYVLFGISEDAGIQANYGRPGARNAWKAALRVLVNVQCNNFNQPEKIVLLGNLDFTDLINDLNLKPGFNPNDLHDTVCKIDEQVSALVEMIVAAGKIPIAIGGGHNNAYGMLKGTSKGLGKKVNAINIDAHADLRPRDYRHSGNGFTYAHAEGFLKRYFMFGLHENYITHAIAKTMEDWADDIKYNSYEQLDVRREKDFDSEARVALDFVADNQSFFGLEIDLDVVENMPASALSPSGFSVEKLRRLNHFFSRSDQLRYLHICEAAPHLENADEMIKVGKTITYLITDFVR